MVAYEVQAVAVGLQWRYSEENRIHQTTVLLNSLSEQKSSNGIWVKYNGFFLNQRR